MASYWAPWRLKSPASRLFTQPFIQGRSKKTSKLRITGLCAWNSPVTGEFPTQMVSNTENVSIWWRHHGGLSAQNEKPPGKWIWVHGGEVTSTSPQTGTPQQPRYNRYMYTGYIQHSENITHETNIIDYWYRHRIHRSTTRNRMQLIKFIHFAIYQ